MADDQTRRQMLAMMLAGAAPVPAAADESDDEPDTDAAPVPTAPGTPYQPLVNRPPKGYSPPYGPPPWASNPLAMALAGGGAPSPSAGQAPAGASPPFPRSAPSSPQQGFLASLLGGGTPSTGSRYNPQTGEFLPDGQGAKPAPTASVGSANQSPANQIAGQVSDIGDDSTMAGYRTEHDAAMTQYRAALAKGDAALAAGNTDAAKIYFNAAQESAKRAEAVNDKAIEYAKPPKEVAEGAHVYNPAKGGYEVPVPNSPYIKVLPEEQETQAEKEAGGEWTVNTKTGAREQVGGTEADTTRAPNEEEIARLTAAGYDPKKYQVSDGKLEPIAPTKIAASDSILGRDGQPIDENLTGEDVYKAVPPTVARMAKGMVDGTIRLPNLTSRTDPTAKQALLVAQQADPSLLDANKVSQRHEIEAGFARATPGSLGGQVNAGNTAADHLADVVEAADDLKNVSGGGVPLIAHIANAVRNNATTGQSGKAGALEDGLLHYGQEISKFYAGAQTGEMERLRFLQALGNAKSPEEMAAVFRMEARQLGGKFVTLDEQVRDTMGNAASRYPVVRGSSKENARRITSGLAALDPAGPEATGNRSPTDVWPGVGPQPQRSQAPAAPSAPGAAQGAPPPGFIKGGYRFKGGDPSQQGNWERAQ